MKPSPTPVPTRLVRLPGLNPVYNFRYQVENNEHYEPQMFKQEENRDGYETHGEYSVLLPDGRTQIVTYQVNGDSGFIADVKFEGEAKYDAYPPKPQPVSQYQPQPTYAPKPAPTYAPAPTYPPPPPPTTAPVYQPRPTYAPQPAPTEAAPPAPKASKREFGPVKFNPFG
eukprot:maker-scaffold2029_size22350-snap-gene-0.8 protein:Tk07084 transcript:maker-scaffold2029_size22350-snap-gene-0.8-mRNA-1 annotation:"Pro-resilin"